MSKAEDHSTRQLSRRNLLTLAGPAVAVAGLVAATAAAEAAPAHAGAVQHDAEIQRLWAARRRLIVNPGPETTEGTDARAEEIDDIERAILALRAESGTGLFIKARLLTEIVAETSGEPFIPAAHAAGPHTPIDMLAAVSILDDAARIIGRPLLGEGG